LEETEPPLWILNAEDLIELSPSPPPPPPLPRTIRNRCNVEFDEDHDEFVLSGSQDSNEDHFLFDDCNEKVAGLSTVGICSIEKKTEVPVAEGNSVSLFLAARFPHHHHLDQKQYKQQQLLQEQEQEQQENPPQQRRSRTLFSIRRKKKKTSKKKLRESRNNYEASRPANNFQCDLSTIVELTSEDDENGRQQQQQRGVCFSTDSEKLPCLGFGSSTHSESSSNDTPYPGTLQNPEGSSPLLAQEESDGDDWDFSEI